MLRSTKKVFTYFISLGEKLILKERSAQKLALSVSVGLFIAFLPFLFTHTLMVFVFSWLFSLNLPAVFVGAVVNNPWTIVPCHMAGYFVGEFFLRTVCRLDPMTLNPSWMVFLNDPIERVAGIQGVSFWSFMIGGHLLAVGVSVIMYPLLKMIFKYLCIKKYGVVKNTVMTKYEDSSSK
ncbi:DUF2062 domain-containing protein [bacterium]|nr:DUF2062 domain-containing protein [bacterium]